MRSARNEDLLGAEPLPSRFYAADALKVARRLLGKILVHETEEGRAAGRIVEVEAYRGPHDRASHTFGGRRTPRNEVMWGPEGRAYIYFVYGMHWCLNAVTAGPGVPEAVLIRAAEPLVGIDLMRERRGTRPKDEHLLRGPACLCKGLGLSGERNGADLAASPLRILDAPPVRARRIVRRPRVGVDYAGDHAALPWRLYVDGSPAVSRP